MSETRLPIGKALPNWKPPTRPARAAMRGHYCSVTPLDPKAHRNDLFTAFAADQYGSDWLYLPYGPFLDVADFSSWLDSAAEKDDPLFFSVIDTTGSARIYLLDYSARNLFHRTQRCDEPCTP